MKVFDLKDSKVFNDSINLNVFHFHTQIRSSLNFFREVAKLFKKEKNLNTNKVINLNHLKEEKPEIKNCNFRSIDFNVI